MQNNYNSSLFPSDIVRPGPVKGGPNFEIHCAPLCAVALISGTRRGAYDALKMNKTRRLNIRRAAVQKFTSREPHRCDEYTHTHIYMCLCIYIYTYMYRHVCVVLEKREKERGKRIKKGRRGSERKGEAERRERESCESIEPT